MITGRKEWDAALRGVDLFDENEPVFIIRGRDICAADAVRDYASRLKLAGAHPKMIESVRTHALRMELWGEKKTPDVPLTESEKAQTAYEAQRAQHAITYKTPRPRIRTPGSETT